MVVKLAELGRSVGYIEEGKKREIKSWLVKSCANSSHKGVVEGKA